MKQRSYGTGFLSDVCHEMSGCVAMLRRPHSVVGGQVVRCVVHSDVRAHGLYDRALHNVEQVRQLEPAQSE